MLYCYYNCNLVVLLELVPRTLSDYFTIIDHAKVPLV